MYGYNERRRAPRVARHIMVRYQVPKQSTWEITPLRDFSRDGARLLCAGAFKPGEPLALWFGSPFFREPVEITTRVVWKKSTSSGGSGLAEYGVCFDSLEAGIRQAIDDEVRRSLPTPS